MKRAAAILALIFVLLAVSCFSAAQGSEEATAQVWENTFYIVNTVKTDDSGYAILVIDNYPTGSMERNYSLVKIDASGRQEWNQTYTLYGNSHLSSLVSTSDGGYALAGARDFSTYGEISSLNGRGLDFWLVKTDKFGSIEWDKTYGGSWHESASSIVETSDGGYALAGYTWSYGEGLWLVKTDSNGTLQWQQWYVGNLITDMVQTDNNGFAFITSSCVLIKTNSHGTVEWSTSFDNGSFQRNLMLETSDKGYAVLCNVYTGYFETVYYSLTKVDARGNILWRQNYTDCDINSFAEISSVGFVLAGSFTTTNSTFPWMAKTNATGNLVWNGTLGNYTGSISSVIETSDHGFFVVGISNSSLWIAKTDANGNVRIPPPELQPPEPFPTVPVVAVSAASIAAVAAGLLLYNRKRRREAQQQ